MKYFIMGLSVGLIFIAIRMMMDEKRIGWTSYVKDGGSTHFIKAPFLNYGNVCMSTVLENKIAVYCYAKDN